VSNVVVLGAGVVGTATGRGFIHLGHEVTLVDRDPVKVDELRAGGLTATTTMDLGGPSMFVLVALPTPSTPGNGYDLSQLVAGLKTLGAALGTARSRHTVVVRSTVPPGTTDELVVPTLERSSGKVAGVDFFVAYAPEFLREASALEDVLSPCMTVLASRHAGALADLTELFAPFGGDLRTFDDPVVAEVVKIAHNAFNATKISFWNEIWRLCQVLEIDSDQVAGTVALSAEGSRNPNYGIRGGFPYAGACLSKDAEGLLGFGRSVGIDLPLVASVQLVNQMMEEHGWLDPTVESESASLLTEAER
jgi:UDPglucose 6-dehydrogenase